MTGKVMWWFPIPSLMVALLVALLVTSAAHAQVVDVTEGPARPVVADGRATQAAPLDQPPFALLYVNVMPGQTTALDDDPRDGTAPLLALGNFHYAAFDVVISAASRVLHADTRESRRANVAALNDLKRMSAHVRIEGLAADRSTVLATSRPDPSVLTLHMSPSNMQFGQAAEPGAAETTVTRAITGATHFLGPVGGLINTFVGAREHPAGPAFFSYQGADNEFGWNWYLSPETTIEGIHRGSALLQVRKDVVYVRVTVDLVTDWAHDGLWTKPYSFLVAVPAPQG